MGKNIKTVLKGFDYMHCDDFAGYLSDMAAKGWHFKEWGVGLKFEKGEPEQATYAVEVFTKASENDMRPEANTQEFAEYCEAAGWRFIDAKQKFCIFKKIDENAVELFTQEERVMNSFKGMLSGSAILLCILYGFSAVMQWANINIAFEDRIFSNSTLFTFLVWNLLFVAQLLSFAHAFWQKFKLKKEIARGQRIYIGDCVDGKYHLNWRDVFVGILSLILLYYFFETGHTELVIMNIVIAAGTIGLALILNKFRPSRETNVLVQIGVSMGFFVVFMTAAVVALATDNTDVEPEIGELPLVIADYREFNDVIDDIDYYHDANILGSMDVYFVFGKEESLSYFVYKSKHEVLLDKVWKSMIEGKKYNEGAIDCSKLWGAKQALRNKNGAYYVRYDGVVLQFQDYEDVYLTEEQIAIILEKLNLR